MSLEGTRCVDFNVTVVLRIINPAATPEKVELTNINVSPRNQVIGGVTIS
jgi:hypothetical protein